jgi:hypothetical protein
MIRKDSLDIHCLRITTTDSPPPCDDLDGKLLLCFRQVMVGSCSLWMMVDGFAGLTLC